MGRPITSKRVEVLMSTGDGSPLSDEGGFAFIKTGRAYGN